MDCTERRAWHPEAMRARLILPLTCLAAVLLAPAAASAKVPESVSCTSTSATVLFWPKGHKVVPGVGFPSIKTPHLEVYKPGAAYPSPNFLLYADSSRFVDPSHSCGIGKATSTGGVRSAKTISSTKAVTCSAPAAISYEVTRTGSGLTVVAHAGPDVYFRATLKRQGSSLTYNRQACKVTATPR